MARHVVNSMNNIMNSMLSSESNSKLGSEPDPDRLRIDAFLTVPRSSVSHNRGRSLSQARAKSASTMLRSSFLTVGPPPPVKIEIHKVGIYGWRKRCLYVLILLIVCLVIINAALIYWIVRLLDLSLVRT